MQPPGPNFHLGETTQDRPPDYHKALLQHEEYCEALKRSGLSLICLPSNTLYPDSTFVEDTAVIFGDRAVLCRPGAPSRRGEVRSIAGCLGSFFSTIRFIEHPGTLDGGDVCQAERHFFIGLSQRTNEDGARQLAHMLTECDYTSSLVDIRAMEGLLHLKSGLAYLGGNRMVVIDNLAEHPEFKDFTLLRVPAGEEYAANCLRVNNYVLIPSGFLQFQDLLEADGCQTITVEMSEFRQMDGGLSCLSLRF